MKYFAHLILLFSIFFSIPLIYADYFEEEIVGADPEIVMIQEIKINVISLRDSKEMKRYSNTATFVTNIKNEAIKRFNDGTISLYRRYDIITNLDSFVYTMNQYFLYQKRYEQSYKNVFKENARSYLEDSKGAYNRLKNALKKSTY